MQGLWSKLLWFVAISVLNVVYVWVYSALASGLTTISQEYQWILAIAIPLMREISVWTSVNACSKTAGGAVPHKLTVSHYLEARCAVFLSIILGGIATPESTYCLLAIDFIINIYHGLKIVRKYNAGEEGLYFFQFRNRHSYVCN